MQVGDKGDNSRIFDGCDVGATSSICIAYPLPNNILLSLRGRVAVATGGTRGIGAAIVRRMAQTGASVVVTGRGKPALKEIEAEIGAMGGSAIGVQADAGSVR